MLEFIIQAITQVLYILILVKVVLSYFMDPYHPIRQTVDRLLDPLLRPIQQVLPTMGGFDFSPLVLLLVIELLSRLILSVL